MPGSIFSPNRPHSALFYVPTTSNPAQSAINPVLLKRAANQAIAKFSWLLLNFLGPCKSLLSVAGFAVLCKAHARLARWRLLIYRWWLRFAGGGEKMRSEGALSPAVTIDRKKARPAGLFRKLNFLRGRMISCRKPAGIWRSLR